MNSRPVTPSTRADPHPIKDFFIAELIDYAPKDHPDMMERPFFSIAKRKRLKPIEYRNDDGNVFVRVGKRLLGESPGGGNRPASNR